MSAASDVSAVACPACGAANSPGAVRCRRCLVELTPGRAPAPAAVAAAPASRAERILDTVRDQMSVRRVLALLLLLAVTWQVVPRLLPREAIPAAVGVLSADAAPDAWGYVHGDAGAARRTAASVDLTTPATWLADLDVATSGPAVVDAEALYVPLEDGRLVALSLADGGVLWEREYGYTLTSAATAAGGRLFVLHRTGSVQALDARDGRTIWEMPGLGGYGVAPVVVGSSVYVLFGVTGSDDAGAVVELDAETGRVLWSAATTQAFPARGIAIDGAHVAVIGARTAEIYDREYGERTFWFTFRYGTQHVALIDGVTYVTTEGETAALDAEASRPWWDGVRGFWNNLYVHQMAPAPPPAPSLWVARQDPRETLAPVVAGETVFVADRAGQVTAHDASTGVVRWSSSGAAVTADPVLTADGLLVARGARLELLDPATGTVIEQGEITDLDGEAVIQAIATEQGLVLVTGSGRLAWLGGTVP